MKFDTEASMVSAALKAALEDGDLTLTSKASAQRLLTRLTTPVRVVILGLPESGKSKLFNLLAGHVVIPGKVDLPTVCLCYGARASVTAHYADGHIATRDDLNIDLLDRNGLVSVEVQAPLPLLERISLTRFDMGDSLPAQRKSLSDAINRADMLIWCTQEFGPEERALWQHVPEPLKDHAFLVLTKAGLLHRQGVLISRMKMLEDVVADEFHSLFPVASLQGLRAVTATPPDPKAFAASGGRALLSGIQRHVEQGRRADLDNARLFLRQYGFAEEVAPPPVVAPEPAPPPPAAAQTTASDALRDRLLDHLDQQAGMMDDISDSPDAADIAGILDSCTETLEGLAMMVQQEDIDDPELAELQEDLEEASEMTLLMQIEADATAAADAITLMLQMRRQIAA